MAATEKNLDKAVGNAVAVEANRKILDDDTLRGITTLAEAFAALADKDVIAESFSDYGTGFDVLEAEQKNALVKVPFMILEWTFNKGDFGEYVAAMVVTEKGQKYVLIDGSTGIRQQLREVTDSRIRNGRSKPQQGLMVEKGLRRSDYTYEDRTTGESRPATTYYLSN